MWWYRQLFPRLRVYCKDFHKVSEIFNNPLYVMCVCNHHVLYFLFQIHVSHDERAAGRCAFASRSVIEGEIVCEYKGELITSAVAAKREESGLYAGKPASMFKIRDTEPKWYVNSQR